jgi:hypothetical protein
MKYEVKKEEKTFTIDDNVFFDKQPKKFRQAYEAARRVETKDEDGNVVATVTNSYASFDNCYAEVFDNGRIIITLKEEEDGTV